MTTPIKTQTSTLTYEDLKAVLSTSTNNSIVIPSNVEAIAAEIQWDDFNITNISFADDAKIQHIPEKCFTRSTKLETITFPSSVTSIGGFSFYKCDKLTNVNLEKTKLQTIGTKAFAFCNALTKFVFPPTLISVDEYAFSGCYNLVEVVFSESSSSSDVATIGNYAFAWCATLHKIIFSKSIQSLGSYVFFKCRQLQNVEFSKHSNLELIGDNCFEECSSLQTFASPSLKKVGKSAFYKCFNLETVTFESLISIDTKGFEGCASLVDIQLPCSLVEVGESAFAKCVKLEKVVINRDESQRKLKLKTYSFAKCKNLKVFEFTNAFPALEYESNCLLGCDQLSSEFNRRDLSKPLSHLWSIMLQRNSGGSIATEVKNEIVETLSFKEQPTESKHVDIDSQFVGFVVCPDETLCKLYQGTNQVYYYFPQEQNCIKRFNSFSCQSKPNASLVAYEVKKDIGLSDIWEDENNAFFYYTSSTSDKLTNVDKKSLLQVTSISQQPEELSLVLHK